MIKVGGIQKTHVLWQAVFLAASPLASGGSAAKTLFRVHHTASYAGYVRYFLRMLSLRRLKRVFRCYVVCETKEDNKEGCLMV